MAGGLFLIDGNMLPKVWELGLNGAIVYFVMCQGTGRDNRTTAWSTNSIEKYTGIGRHRARYAIQANIAAGTICQVRSGKFRKYTITHSPEPAWIFCPNSIVVGADGETPPVERLRRRGSIAALRMLIEAYSLQDLVADEGINWRDLREIYDRKLIAERGLYNVFGFNPQGKITAEWGNPLRAQFGTKHTAEENTVFWDTLKILTESGLLETLPHLVESVGSDAEVIHPMIDDGTEAECELFQSATDAATSLLDDGSGFVHEIANYDFTIPVNCDWPDAQIVGVYRLRYRPHTKATAAWFSRQQVWTQFATEYRNICGFASAARMRA